MTRQLAGRDLRSSLTVVVVVAMLATLLPTRVDVAHADSGTEAAFVAAVNRERANIGLPALAVAGDLTTVARAHSKVMADDTHLHHNPSLGSDVGGWQKVGENVGRGPSVDAIQTAFMASPGHARNVLDPDWTQVGIGVVVRDGRIWVTEVFRKPTGAPVTAAEPTTAPPTAPTSESKPDTKPEATPETKPQPKQTTPAAEPAAPPTEPTAASETEAADADADGTTSGPDDDGATAARHETFDTPLALDRITLTMARMEASERATSLEDVLD